MNEEVLKRIIQRIVTEVVKRVLQSPLHELLALAEDAGRTEENPKAPGTSRMAAGKKRGLLTEDDVRRAVRNGERQVVCPPGTLITPLARDTAGELGVEIVTGR